MTEVDSDPKNAYWHVLDQISFMRWPKSDANLRKALKMAPRGVRLFYLMGSIEGPVENGGFGQYFASPRPLHTWAKRTISVFGFPDVTAIVEEAEQYLKVQSRSKRVHAGMPWDDWVKVMGVVPMNQALRNIHRRFVRACGRLDRAKERYLKQKHEEFV